MISGLGYQEMLLFGVIALMLFGSRLPEVARNFGRTYRELRRKVDEFQREFREWDREDTASKLKSKPTYTPEGDDGGGVEKIEPTAPKFTPPPADDEE